MSLKSHIYLSAIVQATHWNHGVDAERIRMDSDPPITQQFWTAEFNRILKREYGLRRELQSVFLDTYYQRESEQETQVFRENADFLLNYAQTRKPFQCE